MQDRRGVANRKNQSKNIILESKELYKTQSDSQNGQREKLNSFEKVAPSE